MAKLQREEKRELPYLQEQKKQCKKILDKELKKDKPDNGIVNQYERQLNKLDHKLKCEEARKASK